MTISLNQTGRGAIPGALISSISAFMAFGSLTLSIAWAIKSPLINYLLFNTPPPGGFNIAPALLVGVSIGFLFGLVGLLVGCECLPDRTGESRGRLCKVLAWTGIGVSLMTMLIDFVLISFLRLTLEMP